jgi:thiol:disulfide interchange protein DsbD
MTWKLFRTMSFLAGLVGLCLTSLWGQGTQRVLTIQGRTAPVQVAPGSPFEIQLELDIAPGYHINAHVPSLEYLIATEAAFEAPAGIKLGEVQYPAPVQRKFEFSPEQPLAVLEGKVLLTTPASLAPNIKSPSDGNFLLLKAKVTAQACNHSQCLAPATIKLEIPVALAGKIPKPALPAPVTNKSEAVHPTSEGIKAQVSSPMCSSPKPTGELRQFGGGTQADMPANPISNMLSGRGWLVTLLFVFLSGLALNTTPCVYPIIPITIGFFANQGEGRLSRTFRMALLYVLGMATTYSVLGVIASLTKGFFGAALQNPFVLIFLALLMVCLALSMFGLYEFRMPRFLSQLVSRGTQSSGGMLGALMMGLTMGIVAAPCIGPFVLGLLVHVGTKGDPVYGFFLFFVLSMGLGLPYLILGTFSGSLRRLPRSGLWMVTVRRIFGFVLLGMALYFLLPLLGNSSRYVFIAFFFLSALFFLFFEATWAKSPQFAWIVRLIGLGALAAAVFFIIPEKRIDKISWQPYSTNALEKARREGKAVIIDTYADWCIPCKELDKFTFSNPSVQTEAEAFVTLKLNLTRPAAGSDAVAAKDQFGIQGVPTLLFLSPSGEELRNLRLEGFEKPDQFLLRMRQAKEPK